MSQSAIVKKLVSEDVAQVALLRQTNCKNCDNCGNCGQQPPEELLALASNARGARVGQVVEVDSIAGSSIRIAVVVWVLPCIFLVLGYLLGGALGLGELASIGLGGLGVLAGFVPAVLLNRYVSSQQRPEFVIRSQTA